MAHSNDFNLVVLLDMYLGPTAVVSELVRKQLLQEREEESIRMAIEKKAKGEGSCEDLYSTWLSYSGLDFDVKSQALVAVVNDAVLHRAMFDLMLGPRVKAYQLNGYQEVHEARTWIKNFFSMFHDKIQPILDTTNLWWDSEVSPDEVASSPWISATLREDPDFLKLVENWLGDNERLQRYLDDFEFQAHMSNNPKGPYPVLSESVAKATLKFSQVRFQSSWSQSRS